MGPENIPHLSEANIMSMDAINGHHSSKPLSNMEMSNSKSEEETLKRHSISSWSQDNDDGTDGGDDGGALLDDNVSQVGSDYSEIPTNDMFGPHAMSSDGYPEDIKYNPAEMMLRPSSSSAIQFSYNFPPLPTLTQHHPTQRLHPPPPHPSVDDTHQHPQHQHMPVQPHMFRDPRDMCVSPSTDYSPNSHPSQSYFHSNMWYPNAPIGPYRSYGSHPYGRQFETQFSHDHMMDMFQLSNSGREARNRAEKNRRDKLNGSIQELSTIVPHVAESPRRVDKTTVLKLATHGLRLKYVFGKSLNNQSVQTTDALMQLLDSFFLTLTCNGQIVLASSSIEQHLGHCQTDLYGQNILHITHPEDHQMLKQKLIPTDLDSLFDIQPEDENGEPRQRTQAEEEEIDRRLKEDRRSFTIRLARSGPRSEATTYELVKIDGSFRRSDMAPRGLKTSTFPSTLQLMRRSRGREDIMPLHTISGNDIVLIAIARIVRPPVINPVLEANRLEYKTRHLIDGRIIDCDQRISLVAGYMTDEVRNLSPFTFMHQDDVRWVIVALRQMYDCNSSYGESTYRLFTRNGKIIYLHTKGFLEIDKSTNKVHSFICVNTLLTEEEGKRRVQNMKNKFSVIIDTKIPQSFADVPASENPLQLEKAVLCLIQNLQQSASDDETDSSRTPSLTSPSSSKSQKNPYSHQHHNHQHSSYNTPAHVSRSSKTPPLALVPPGADSIKNSITKSVCVVKTTAGKFLHTQNCDLSQRNGAEDSGCGGSTSGESRRYSSNMDSDDYSQNTEQQTVPYSTTTATGATKRKINYSISENENDGSGNGDEDDDDDDVGYRVPIQRKAIENVLSNSLQQLDNRLNQEFDTAVMMELRDKDHIYDVPQSEGSISNLMEEHRKQREIYGDITDDFEFQDQFENGDVNSDNETHSQNTHGNVLSEPVAQHPMSSPTYESSNTKCVESIAQQLSTESDVEI